MCDFFLLFLFIDSFRLPSFFIFFFCFYHSISTCVLFGHFQGYVMPSFFLFFFFVSIFVQPMTEHASKTLCTLCWLHYCCLVIFTCGKPYWFLREWLVVNAATLESVLCHIATSVMFTCQISNEPIVNLLAENEFES